MDAAPSVLPSTARIRNDRREERRCFTGMAIVFLLVAFIGFAPTYYLGRFYGAPKLTALVHIHAIIALLSAALARIGRQVGVPGPGALLAGTIMLVVIALAWDWRATGRVHAVLLWGGLICIASQPIRQLVSRTPAWMAIAHRLMGSG